jgi:BON domain
MLISRKTTIPDSSSSDEGSSRTALEHHEPSAAGQAAETLSIDRHLRERILDRLAQRGIRLSDELTLDVFQRAVTIRGRVDSYYQRQLLIHSIRLVPGISGIEDVVDVAPPADPRRFLCQQEPAISQQRDMNRFRALGAIAFGPLDRGGETARACGNISGYPLAGGRAM